MGLEQKPFWVRDRNAFGSGTQSSLGPGPTCIWVQDRFAFGSRTDSHLGPGQNFMCVRVHSSKSIVYASVSMCMNGGVLVSQCACMCVRECVGLHS